VNPEISIVIPTTGSITRLERCLDSLTNQLPSSFLQHTELIIFLNTRNKKSDLEIHQHLLGRYSERVSNFQVKFGNEYLWTAEESAFEASKWATKEYIWIIGDQRIFLPDGLRELDRILKTQNPVGVFFNSIWINSSGINLGEPSLSMGQTLNKMSYKEFVIMTGYNYMPTNFGSWIVKRKYLNQGIWEEVVVNSGWHFSHVATYLMTLSKKEIFVSSTFLTQMELKDYHIGDSTGWEEYARVQEKIRFSPWVETLPKQLSYLIKKEVISHDDLRVALINEGKTFKRLIDELYQFTFLQIKLSKAVSRERLPEETYLTIRDLLRVSSPERIHANYLLDQAYFEDSLSNRELRRIQKKIERIILQDNISADYPLISLVIGSISDFWIRIHPSGFVLSPKNDFTFLEKYRVINKNDTEFSKWIFCKDAEGLVAVANQLNSNISASNNFQFSKEKISTTKIQLKKFLARLMNGTIYIFIFRSFLIMLLNLKIFLLISYYLPIKLKGYLRRKFSSH
jgi:hypothetical protein